MYYICVFVCVIVVVVVVGLLQRPLRRHGQLLPRRRITVLGQRQIAADFAGG